MYLSFEKIIKFIFPNWRKRIKFTDGRMHILALTCYKVSRAKTFKSEISNQTDKALETIYVEAGGFNTGQFITLRLHWYNWLEFFFFLKKEKKRLFVSRFNERTYLAREYGPTNSTHHKQMKEGAIDFDIYEWNTKVRNWQQHTELRTRHFTNKWRNQFFTFTNGITIQIRKHYMIATTRVNYKTKSGKWWLMNHFIYLLL